MSEMATEQEQEGLEGLEEASAETENTDSPQTVPYSRFKEVNDQYKEFKTFSDDTGYDLDDLRQLTEFEDRFAADPSGTWVALARQLGDQLPEPLRNALAELENSGEPAQKSPPEDSSAEEEPPVWAKPLLEDYETRQTERQEQQFQDVLDGIVEQWNEQDQEEKLIDDEGRSVFTDKQKLTYITAHLRKGVSADKVLESARTEAKDFRENMLRGSVVRPPAAPKSTGNTRGATAGTKPEPPKTLLEASRMARQELLEE